MGYPDLSPPSSFGKGNGGEWVSRQEARLGAGVKWVGDARRTALQCLQN